MSCCRFVIQERLGHTWRDEVVGFPWDGGVTPAIRPAGGGAPLPAQLSGGRVWFTVAELPALGRAEFIAEPADSAPPAPCATATPDGDTLVVSNGVLAVRVPATQRFAAVSEGQRLPAPLLGVRRGQAPWIGNGWLCASPDQTLSDVAFSTLEEGPLWCRYRLTYHAGEHEYEVELRLDAGSPCLRIAEHSTLCHDSAWSLDIAPGFQPQRAAFGHHRTWGKTAFLDLEYTGRQHLGDVQAPDQNIHFFADDFDAYSFLAGPVALGLAATDDGDWTFLAQNPISMKPGPGPSLVLSASCKAGVRKWMLFFADAAAYNADDYFTSPAAGWRRKFETPLDWVKDMVLDWEDRPDADRPLAACDREDIARARRLFRDWEPLRRYAQFLDRDAELVQGQYDAGGHYPLDDQRREDPMCAWLAQPDDKTVEILKRGLFEGIRRRVEAFLGPRGHRHDIVTSINLGRTLRPFMQMYDILAPQMAMTDEERRWFKAAVAFLCYKIVSPHYWNAEAIVLHSDHPRSSHRTAWFPSRDSDWCTYNVDTAPHNFHTDLYTALGAAALVFPGHPCARQWVDWTVSFIERELDNWVFPNGAFIESATYTLAFMNWWVPYFVMLRQCRVRDYFLDERFQRLCRGLCRVQGPYDKRIRRHSFTVMGDAMYPSGGANTLAWVANFARADRPFSAMLMGAWQRSGCQLNNPGQQGMSMYDALFIDPDLPARPLRRLPSEHVQGYGLILRHAHGSRKEVYLFIKCGKIYSHFHYDEGAFFVFADQVPILDEYGIQYGTATNEKGEKVPGFMPGLHNAISFSGTPTDRECYNRGYVTRFLTRDWADYAVCEMPIHLLHMKPSMSLWGFQGEEAPYGWWRRHILYIKPHGFFFYDQIESEFTATLDLNVKAARFESLPGPGLRRLYEGRYGADLPVCVNAPTDGAVRDDAIHMEPTASAFAKFSTMESVSAKMKATFYDQLGMHVTTGPNRDFSWAFAWGSRRQAPRLSPLGEGLPGSCLASAAGETRAVVAPWIKPAVVIASPDMVYNGWAGAVTRRADGGIELMQMSGNRIGIPGGIEIGGDGPFRLSAGEDAVTLEVGGRARWLTARRPGGICEVRNRQGEALPLTPLGDGAVQFAVPAGESRLVLG
ncbi:MAG: hypothetical protein BWZ02_00758 [Lentisphaerae bacterium ADurb.BinA184]|nr:MAG: hypothetical protein BWZ02_00758 [Lentisphaerae bacterium ADurb.BinA184]